jgi:hypothetical protein
MAGISNIKLSAQQLSSSTWKLTVNYTATFSQFEVNNFTFRDGFEIWEEDTSDDDKITGLVGGSSFKPSSTQVQRTLVYQISGDSLDTELGAEEIYVIVQLWTNDISTTPVRKKSGIINISP